MLSGQEAVSSSLHACTSGEQDMITLGEVINAIGEAFPPTRETVQAGRQARGRCSLRRSSMLLSTEVGRRCVGGLLEVPRESKNQEDSEIERRTSFLGVLSPYMHHRNPSKISIGDRNISHKDIGDVGGSRNISGRRDRSSKIHGAACNRSRHER